MQHGQRVGFAIGTGRCGTLFLHQLMALESAVASSHERNPENESFHRYCKWNGLPVDDEGFLATKEREIRSDLEAHQVSFEASPYLSLSVKELHQRFGAKFVLLIRRPDGVVTSFVHKGFYRRPYSVKNVDLAAGYQDNTPEKVHSFFARVAPKGEFFSTWNAMTPVGKVAWFWRAWNERTLELLKELPAESYQIIRIEDLDYAAYVRLCGFLGFGPQVSESQFDSLRDSKPHAFWRKRNIDEWNDTEVQEFESQVAELAQQFDYEFRVAELVPGARRARAEAERLGHIPPPRKAPRLWRIRRGVAGWLQKAAKAVDVV